jgi:drug/metabolite transporter (DMT)-like permease
MTTISRKTLIAGGLLAVASSALFTGKVIVAKLAYRHGIDPLGLMLLRMLFSAPVYCFMLLFELRRGVRIGRADILKTVALGIAGYYLTCILDFTGVEYISTALERMLLQLSPSVVMIVGALFLGEKLERRLVFAMALGYAGVALMVQSELWHAATPLHASHAFLGVVLVTAATVIYALYVMGAERLMQRVDSSLFTSLGMLSASLGVCTHYVVARGFTAPTHDASALWLCLVMAVFCTIVPSYIVNRAIHMIGGARMGPFNYVGMGLTFILSAVLLDEAFPPLKLAGILFAVAGALALTLGRVRRETAGHQVKT